MTRIERVVHQVSDLRSFYIRLQRIKIAGRQARERAARQDRLGHPDLACREKPTAI
jgi:hypothetical protein